MVKLCTNLKIYRKRASMTQEQLAQKAHVRRETILHLENGKYNPSLKLAMDIANVFKVRVDEMFWFEQIDIQAESSAKLDLV